ncbi:MAG: DUF433 domain-containing protein [Anaerolineales bacterium]|nr:DUF433 domain-containing protein [Anaerolineales bacterium]
MQLEEYLDFLAPNDIRIKGHRIGLELILYEYIYNELTPAQLRERFPTLTLEQIYAVLAYYHHHQPQLDQYLADWLEFGRRAREEQAANPPPVVRRLRRLAAMENQAA